MSACVEITKILENIQQLVNRVNDLSISPKNSRIITVFLSVLERIFEINRSLVGNDGLVLKKPGAADGS